MLNATANDNTSSIDATHPAFKHFLEVAQTLVDRDRNAGRVASLSPDTISAEVGRRYIRIVCTSGPQRASWAFVDRVTGDILKAANWASPAKHPRGNILREDFQGLSGYGPAYLR